MKNREFTNIVLTGMRGSGKTTLGKLLAKKLKMDFIDTDVVIEKSEKLTISQIIEQFGWEYFRKAEKECIKKISDEVKNSIISTGGGIILNNKNVLNLKENGLIIFINTPVEILSKRIHDTTKRPSLTGENVKEELQQVWLDRKEKYLKSADIVYNKNDIRLDINDAKDIIGLITDQTKSK